MSKKRDRDEAEKDGSSWIVRKDQYSTSAQPREGRKNVQFSILGRGCKTTGRKRFFIMVNPSKIGEP